MESAAKRACHEPPLPASAIVLARYTDLLALILSFVPLEERVALLTRVCRAWSECVATNPFAWSRGDRVESRFWRADRPLPRALHAANTARALFYRIPGCKIHPVAPTLSLHRVDTGVVAASDEVLFSPFLEEIAVYRLGEESCRIYDWLSRCTSLRELDLDGALLDDTGATIEAATRGGTLRSLRITLSITLTQNECRRIAGVFSNPALVAGLEKLYIRANWRDQQSPDVDVMGSQMLFKFERLCELAINVSFLEDECFFRIDAPVRALTVEQHNASLRTIASLVRVADLETLSIVMIGFAATDYDDVCLPAVTNLKVTSTPFRLTSMPPNTHADAFAAAIGRTLPHLRHLCIARSPIDRGWLQSFVGHLHSASLESISITKWRGGGADAFAERLRFPDARARLPALTKVIVM